MKIAIIGRTKALLETTVVLRESAHEIACILTAKEAPEYTRTADDFHRLAETCNIPFAKGAKIGEHIDFLEKAGADVAVSVNYTGVIPQSVIDIFPLGILNAHGGDLPRYRGNACQAWAILNGEEKIGLCIHKMIGGELDSGDIIARDYFSISPNTKISQVLDWMAEQIPHMFLQAIEQLSVDPSYVLKVQSKLQRDALRCYPRKPEDGRIDWTKPALDVLRLINASGKPYAGAYCNFEGGKLVVRNAELLEDGENFCAVPGQVTAIGETWIDVACGEGKLRLLEIETNGETGTPNTRIKSIRKRMT